MSNVIPFPIERWRRRSDQESITALWFAPMHYWCMTMSIMTTDRPAAPDRIHAAK
jgi:hypothetical protein